MQYTGTCICEKVKFEIELDLATSGTFKCNCSNCLKSRLWGAFISIDSLTISSGKDELSTYLSEMGNAHHFCKHCGVRVFARGEQGKGTQGVIFLNTLDNLDPKDLVNAPIQYYDGAHDNWETPPEFIAHL